MPPTIQQLERLAGLRPGATAAPGVREAARRQHAATFWTAMSISSGSSPELVSCPRSSPCRHPAAAATATASSPSSASQTHTPSCRSTAGVAGQPGRQQLTSSRGKQLQSCSANHMVPGLPEPEVSGLALDLSDVLDPQDELLPPPGTSSTSQPSMGFRKEVLAARPKAPDPALLRATDEERGTRAAQALEALLSHGDPGSERHYRDEAELLQSVSDVLLQPEHFTANAPQQFGLAAWRYVLIGHYQRRQRQVPRRNTRLLSMLRKGYRWTWQPCSAADPKKLDEVSRMVARTVGQGKEAPYLSGDRPMPIQFPNHASAHKHGDFLRAKVLDMVRQGAARVWDGPEPPHVVHPLAVVEQGAKLREILDARFACLGLKYLRV